jgi:hypothetical protein
MEAEIIALTIADKRLTKASGRAHEMRTAGRAFPDEVLPVPI